MPPESLFRHSLRCPSSPGAIDLGVLESLHYPKSLKSEDELRKENRFVQPLQESDADLCFSIDEYGDFDSNFFYRDCPSVVCSSEIDSTKRTFTLPGVLSVHCDNFVSSGVRETKVFDKERVRILPSELWAMRSEIGVWNDYPHSYSFSVLQVVLYLPMIKEHDSLKWIISNAPRYGVVIDAAMRDHVYLLMKLCLRAISYEASHSNELLRSRISTEGVGDLNPRSLSFACPVLVEVLTWFASQLSVLYGEANGRLFSIEMLKHCMSSAASRLVLYLSDQKKTVVSASTEGCGKLDPCGCAISVEYVGAEGNINIKTEEPTENCERENLFCGESTRSDLVFVSQVAAAIAALHERSLLEEKIKGLRLAGSLSKSQLISEHAYVTKKADEERKKRPNYRPILEYDGLLWHRSHNEDSNKMKTKEELLAEERDYKRRRSSYRGKKVKRSITEVMRDIIEDHMEEIKQAGGIGCFVKGSAEGVVFPSSSVSVREITADVELRNLGFDSSEAREEQRFHSRKPLHSNNLTTSFENANQKDRHRRESHSRYEPPDVHSRITRKENQDREYRSRSPESYRSHRHSHGRHRHQRELDERKVTKTKFDENRRSHESMSTSSMSNLSTDFSDGKYEMPQAEGRYRGRGFVTHRSNYMTQSMFDDRYDPSESYGRHDETYSDVSSGSKYARAEKSYKSK